MENSSRLFSILYPDLQYLAAITTGTWEPPNSRSGILVTWEPPKVWIWSFGYLGTTKSLDPEFWVPGEPPKAL